MNYIEKNLMEGEYIVYQAHLSILAYVGPIVVGLLGAVVGFLPLVFADELPNWLLIVASVMLLASLLWALVIQGGRQYTLTNRRLIEKRGIITRQSLELLLRKCEGVSIRQSLTGRILGYGTVTVTTGEATNSFDYISNPIRFSTLINQQIDKLQPSELAAGN